MASGEARRGGQFRRLQHPHFMSLPVHIQGEPIRKAIKESLSITVFVVASKCPGRGSRRADDDRRIDGANSAEQMDRSRKVVPCFAIMTKPFSNVFGPAGFLLDEVNDFPHRPIAARLAFGSAGRKCH